MAKMSSEEATRETYRKIYRDAVARWSNLKTRTGEFADISDENYKYWLVRLDREREEAKLNLEVFENPKSVL